jgi:hypothetical protein
MTDWSRQEKLADPLVIGIVGMPGAGKTHLGAEYATQGYLVFDDLGRASKKEDALRAIAEGKKVVIIDPHLCFPENRKAVERLVSTTIEWIFFENNPEQCLLNVKKRNDGRKVENFIRLIAKHYKVPEGAVSLPVYKGD